MSNLLCENNDKCNIESICNEAMDVKSDNSNICNKSGTSNNESDNLDVKSDDSNICNESGTSSNNESNNMCVKSDNNELGNSTNAYINNEIESKSGCSNQIVPLPTSPQFLTNKLKLETLAKNKNVYDFQLKDHFLNKSTLSVLQCNCISHKHNKQPCIIVAEPICPKCKTPTKQLISFQSLMYHTDLMHKKLTKCCHHTHSPPCNRCINCQIGRKCIVPETFDCYESTCKFF